MSQIEAQKLRLEQKKNRLAAAETILKIKEQKLYTRNLIKLGELITKAKLDTLPVNTLYGALLSISEQLEKNSEIKSVWTEKGNAILNDKQQEKTAIILKFDEQPSGEILAAIRSHGLRWNNLRKEWGGYVSDLESLKDSLKNTPYNLEVIS